MALGPGSFLNVKQELVSVFCFNPCRWAGLGRAESEAVWGQARPRACKYEWKGPGGLCSSEGGWHAVSSDQYSPRSSGPCCESLMGLRSLLLPTSGSGHLT